MISSATSWAGVLSAPSPSRAPPRSFTTTLAPSLARSSASPRPIPRPAPVTIATFPSSAPIYFLLVRRRTLLTPTSGTLTRLPTLEGQHHAGCRHRVRRPHRHRDGAQGLARRHRRVRARQGLDRRGTQALECP